MFLVFTLISFSFFLQASLKDLVIPLYRENLSIEHVNVRFGIDDDYRKYYLLKDETENQFFLRMNTDNKHIVRIFSVIITPDGEMFNFFMIKTEHQLQNDEKSLPQNKNADLRFFNRIFSFKNLLSSLFLTSYYSQNKIQFPWFAEYNFQENSKKSMAHTKIFSWDCADKTLFCVDTQRNFEHSYYPIWYADCYYLEHDDYKNLYQPIANLKEIEVTNIVGVIRNICFFLKHAFYDACGNKRLQKSLFSIFVANAHAPIAWLFACYYGVILLISSKLLFKGITHVRIIERIFLVHFTLHLFFNYAVNYGR